MLLLARGRAILPEPKGIIAERGVWGNGPVGLAAFRFRWFSCKMGVQCPPQPHRDAPLGDCWTTWKTNWNAKSHAQLQAALQQVLDDYQPLCEQCRLAMHRHHHYARAIATGYGEVRLQIPVFRCGQCRRMAGGMTLLGEEMRHQLGHALD